MMDRMPDKFRKGRRKIHPMATARMVGMLGNARSEMRSRTNTSKALRISTHASWYSGKRFRGRKTCVRRRKCACSSWGDTLFHGVVPAPDTHRISESDLSSSLMNSSKKSTCLLLRSYMAEDARRCSPPDNRLCPVNDRTISSRWWSRSRRSGKILIISSCCCRALAWGRNCAWYCSV